MPPKRKKPKNGLLHHSLRAPDHNHSINILCTTAGVTNKSEMEAKKNKENHDLTPLQRALMQGDFNICKKLIKEGADLTSKTFTPPLFLALEKGFFEIAKLIIKAGADVNLLHDNCLPMYFALERDYCPVDIVKELITAGFPKNGIVHLTSKETALHVAIRMDHLSIVKYLFTLSVDPNVRDAKGLLPFYEATRKFYPDMVKLLMRNGAQINIECKEYLTPIFIALAVENYDMVKLLITLGANVNFITDGGSYSMAPLHFAANLCSYKTTQLLLDKGADVNLKIPSTGETPLHSVARARDRSKSAQESVVELLVQQGSSLKTRHKAGLTPLQVAIKAGNYNIARILIQHGSELNNDAFSEGEKYCATFHLAARTFNKDLIQTCLDYGADCFLKDGEGVFPCHLVILSGMFHLIASDHTPFSNLQTNQNEQVEIFKMFWKFMFPFDLTLKMKGFEQGIPLFPNIINGQLSKQRMLFNALKSQRVKDVQSAIAQGAEVRCCSTEIPFPLHYITKIGNEAILKIFLSGGVHVNVLDKEGQTPLFIAAKTGNINCCKLLLEYGACYNYVNPKSHKTPLQVAKINGHTKIATLLEKVGRYFKRVKEENFTNINPNMKIFTAVMNCCNRDGMTLMGRALSFGKVDVANRLMTFRVAMP